MKLVTLAMTAALIAAPALVSAQSNREINQRHLAQQHRIAQGVHSGQLTPREAGRLERNQRSIRHQQQRMRAAHNGRLTRRDRRVLSRRQNAASRHIYRARHNHLVD